MSNVFAFCGRIGRNSELKNLSNGSVLNFAVANDVGFGDKKTTMWIDCDLWGKRGENLAQWLVKGQQVFVSGELSTRTYQAKDGSGEKTALSLNVQSLDMVGKKDAQPAPAPAQQYTPPPPPPQQYNGAAYQAAQNGNTYDEDIPF